MKVIFCIPGNNFTNRFLKCWTRLTQDLNAKDIEYELLSEYIPNVYLARSLLLGGADGMRPSNPKSQTQPWQGKKEYDYIMWIDSDQVFEPKQFFKLLEHDKDIVSGLYFRQPPGGKWDDVPISYACLVEQTRGLYSHDIDGSLIKVWGNGMGWMLIKKGVFEKVSYPWFAPIHEGIGIHGEDTSFQIRAREAGFDSFVDTSIIVGHEKNVVLI